MSIINFLVVLALLIAAVLYVPLKRFLSGSDIMR